MDYLKKNIKGIVVVAMFAVYLFIGLASFKDYGVPIDEFWQENIGFVNLKHIMGFFISDIDQAFPNTAILPSLHDYVYKDYGPFFEILIVGIQQALNIESFTPEASFVRHLLMFLAYFVSIIFLYLLLFKRFNDFWIAFSVTLFAIITPRFFAESFYNTKDTLFYSMIIISCYYLYSMLKRPNIFNSLLAAVFTGFAISLRLFALLLPLMFAGYILIVLIQQRKNLRYMFRNIGFIFQLLYIPLTLVFLIALFPFLWSNPFSNLAQVFAGMSNYALHGEVVLLHFGSFIPENDLPWHYIPFWIGVTTPVFILVLFFTGLYFLVTNNVVVKRIFNDKNKLFDIFILSLFILPLLAVIVNKSVLYNGWRHMYFLYFPIIYFNATALQGIFAFVAQRSKYKYALVSVIAICIAYFSWWNIKNHPFQYAYFNILPGNKENFEKNFPVDYWGLSYKQGLEFVLDYDKSDTIYVYTRHYMFDSRKNPNFHIIPQEQVKRLVPVTDFESADYYLTEHYQPGIIFEGNSLVYEVKANKVRVMSVYKLK